MQEIKNIAHPLTRNELLNVITILEVRLGDTTSDSQAARHIRGLLEQARKDLDVLLQR